MEEERMTSEDKHKTYMRLALAEARKGLGRTSPNPAVGALLVRDGVILGRGFHKQAGAPHAEINALADARLAGHDPRGATMYVTLEPCNHSGRTPPCTEAILADGISEVFTGTRDPNPQVTGGGAAFLRANGVQVTLDICREECRQVILPFAKHQRSAMPWVVMKAGMSLDAKITPQKGQGGAITGPEAGRYVHRLRNQLDAILVGVGTAVIDNPSLTTRLEDASEEGRDPLRIVLDSSLRLAPDCRMLRQQSSSNTWIFCREDADTNREKRLEEAGAEVIRLAREEKKSAGLNLRQVLLHLGRAGITSLLVEGGAQVHGSFLAEGLVDEVALIVAPYFIGEAGTPLVQGYSRLSAQNPLNNLSRTQTKQLGRDLLIHGYFTDPDSLFQEP